MPNSFVTPQTVAHQAIMSMRFLRQEYWSWLPLPSPGILPTQGSNLPSPVWQENSLPLSHLGYPKLNYMGRVKRDLEIISSNDF